MENNTFIRRGRDESIDSGTVTRDPKNGSGLTRCLSVLVSFAVLITGMVSIPMINEIRTEEAIKRQQAEGFLQYASLQQPKQSKAKSHFVKADYAVEAAKGVELVKEHPFKYASQAYASGTVNAIRRLLRASSKINNAKQFSEEHKCLAEAVYYEARSEVIEGQLAVAEVIMNRVADERYPKTICGVVNQGSNRSTGCQFTFTCDGSRELIPYGDRWMKARSVAAQVVLQFNELRTGNATHYHASYVQPSWSKRLIQTNAIGEHIFYRYPNRGHIRVANNRQSISTGRNVDLVVTP